MLEALENKPQTIFIDLNKNKNKRFNLTGNKKIDTYFVYRTT